MRSSGKYWKKVRRLLSFNVWNGEEIKKMRKRFGLNQTELAERLGTVQQQVSAWESENKIPQRAYQKLITQAYEKLLEELNVIGQANPKGE